MTKTRKPPSSTTLHDFADLRRALRKAAREAALQAALERAARAAREAEQFAIEAERELFKHTVGAVHTLNQSHSRAVMHALRPAPIPKMRQQDEAAVLQESLSDDFDVDTLLETDEALSWRRPEVGADVTRKLRRGVWAVQGQLDLHGLRSNEAREQFGAFLRSAGIKGWRCVRVIHGKGLGSPGQQPVLKDKVRRWLGQTDRVLAFVQARGADGGAGASVILLAPGKGPRLG